MTTNRKEGKFSFYFVFVSEVLRSSFTIKTYSNLHRLFVGKSDAQAIYLTTSKTFETSTPAPAPSASCLALACSRLTVRRMFFRNFYSRPGYANENATCTSHQSSKKNTAKKHNQPTDEIISKEFLRSSTSASRYIRIVILHFKQQVSARQQKRPKGIIGRPAKLPA